MSILTKTLARPRKGGRGFTLAELLVVVGIVGLLAALVGVTVDRAMAMGRRTHCSMNEKHLAEAYNMYRAAELRGEEKPFAVLDQWAIRLVKYLGDHPRALYCLEDERPRKFNPLPTLGRRAPGQAPEDAYDLGLFSGDPVWEEGAYKDVVMDPPTAVWKVSEEDYRQLSLAEGRSQTDNLPKYDPGKNPNVYYMLVNDDVTGDYDFEDIVFRVEEDPDTGTATMEVAWEGYTYFTLDLYGPLGEEWLDVGDSGAGPFVFPGRGPLSYGMNWHADNLSFGGNFILALDFRDDVVYVGAESNVVHWPKFVAQRHLGKTNVVYVDGSVRTVDVETIDPTVEANRRAYWNPVGLRE